MKVLIPLLLAIAACKSSPSSSSPSTTPAAAQPVSTSGSLVALELGDRCCYVRVTTPAGERVLDGAFDLCEGGARDATNLIGQPVQWRTEPGEIPALSCEGEPECTETEKVVFVVDLIPET